MLLTADHLAMLRAVEAAGGSLPLGQLIEVLSPGVMTAPRDTFGRDCLLGAKVSGELRRWGMLDRHPLATRRMLTDAGRAALRAEDARQRHMEERGPLRDALRRLRTENEELLAERESLRAALYGEVPSFTGLGLNRQQRTLLSLLMRFDSVTHDQAYAAFEADLPRAAGRCVSFPSTILHLLRRDLAPKGVGIETIWGVGFRLTPEAKARIRELCGERQGRAV